jgi:hypothetical protein
MPRSRTRALSQALASAGTIILGLSLLLTACGVAPLPSPTNTPSLPTPMATPTEAVPTIGAPMTAIPAVSPEPTVTLVVPTVGPVAPKSEGLSTPTANGYQEGFTDYGAPFQGNPKAPVVMEEFSSYQ